MHHQNQYIPLLITSAIYADAPNTKLNDSNERLTYTLAAIRNWLSLGTFSHIVVCDGSDFDLTNYLQKLKEEVNTDVKLEALHFQNDTSTVKRLGKGFGEGQIVAHALKHSSILAAATSFAKCTSKLYVSNAFACLRHYNGTAALNLSGGIIPNNVDTRFYICSKYFYFRFLQNCHLNVDESHGIYLEHRFFDAINSLPLFRKTIKPTPMIFGVSGSMGRPHKASKFNALIKDARNFAFCLIGR